MELYEFLIAFTAIGGPVLVLCIFLYLRHRNRVELQTTVRQALDKGQDLTPELLERLGEGPRPPDGDLRRGILAVTIALAVGAFGLAIGEEDAVGPLLGIAAFPLFIGIAYLALWKLRRQPDRI